MRNVLITAAILFQMVWVCPEIEAARPRLAEVQRVVSAAPTEYQKALTQAFKKAGSNGHELIAAIHRVKLEEREGVYFLIANMPARDLVSLRADFIVENVRLAYQAWKETPWGNRVPQDIFLNDVLPYASLNERRDDWRRDFHQRFLKKAKESGSIELAVTTLNKVAFEELKVSYHPSKRPKPDQSPYESMRARYASCTGLSILLVDVLRSVGIPARVTGIPRWSDESGNHTWVEIWDGKWHYIGAAEPTELDQTWFTTKAAETNPTFPKNRIYATSFKQTGLSFPMVWAPHLNFVPAVDVTDRYKKIKAS